MGPSLNYFIDLVFIYCFNTFWTLAFGQPLFSNVFQNLQLCISLSVRLLDLGMRLMYVSWLDSKYNPLARTYVNGVLYCCIYITCILYAAAVYYVNILNGFNSSTANAEEHTQSRNLVSVSCFFFIFLIFRFIILSPCVDDNNGDPNAYIPICQIYRFDVRYTGCFLHGIRFSFSTDEYSPCTGERFIGYAPRFVYASVFQWGKCTYSP